MSGPLWFMWSVLLAFGIGFLGAARMNSMWSWKYTTAVLCGLASVVCFVIAEVL